jgi:hypothetical protein
VKQQIKTFLAGGFLALALFGAAAASPFHDARAAFQHGDYARGLQILRPLAEQGSAEGQLRFGWMYANGWGVPQIYSPLQAGNVRAGAPPIYYSTADLSMLEVNPPIDVTVRLPKTPYQLDLPPYDASKPNVPIPPVYNFRDERYIHDTTPPPLTPPPNQSGGQLAPTAAQPVYSPLQVGSVQLLNGVMHLSRDVAKARSAAVIRARRPLEAFPAVGPSLRLLTLIQDEPVGG